MDDAELARRLQAGDASAWGEVYDRYADQLHDYCATILRDRHEAEDALHDAFVTAAGRIGQLRDPARLRPWLYAVCRSTALGRARKRSRAVPTEAVGAMTPTEVARDPVEQSELQQVVWEAAAGLTPQDRAVLDLHLRHGLVGQELAEALEVTPHHATVRLARVRELVERSLTVLLVGRIGRRDCPELDALLQGWDGRLEPTLRKRVARHIDGCEVCEERRRTMVSPLALLAAAPLVPAPADLRSRVLTSLDADGRPPAGGRRGRGPLVAALVALVAVLVGTVAFVAGAEDDHGATPSTTAAPTTVPSTTTTLAPSISVELHPGSSTTLPTATAGQLEVLTATHHLGADGGSFEVRLHNGGGSPIEWTAGVDLAAAGVSPASGSTDPGQTTTVVVSVDRSGLAEGPFAGTVALAGRDPGDGSPRGSARVPFDGRTERRPQIGSTTADRTFLGVNGPAFCKVSAVHAQVDDESAVSVAVHWRGGGVAETQAAMTPEGGTWLAQLGPATAAAPITWWVEATDSRGNHARGADHTMTVEAVC